MVNTFLHAFWQSSAHTSLDDPFDPVRTVLSDPTLTALICAPNMQSVAERGLPFTSCDVCVILGLPDVATNAIERAQLAGLLVLVTRPTGVAVLNADVPDLAMLAAYASCHVVWFSQHEAQLAPYLADGGMGVFLRGQQIWSARAGELAVCGNLLLNLDVVAQLAAWALLHASTVFPNGGNAKTQAHAFFAPLR
jgi:hypothetical protein